MLGPGPLWLKEGSVGPGVGAPALAPAPSWGAGRSCDSLPSPQLCMVSLSLFRTLLNLSCEDVLLQLVLRYPGLG